MNPISSHIAKRFTWEFWQNVSKYMNARSLLALSTITPEHEKIRVSLETGVESWRALPEECKEFCQKLAWNTGLSGFNVFIKTFVSLRDYQ